MNLSLPRWAALALLVALGFPLPLCARGGDGAAVPLDSWIYPALERLAAMGYIGSAHAGMRPWTRSECARQLQEAAPALEAMALAGSEAEGLYRALALNLPWTCKHADALWE